MGGGMTGLSQAKKWTAFVLTAVVLAVGACQRADAQRLGGADANSPPSELTFSETFRIGDDAAGDSVPLGFVRAMAVDSKGQLYVTGSESKGIRMFSSDGVLIGEFGREGEGAGEFAETPSIHIGPGDSLYAWDRRAFRLTTFSPQDQSLVASVTVVNSANRALRPFAFLGATNRGLLMEFSSFYPPDSEESSKMARLAKLVHWDGTVAIDTLAQLPVPVYVPIDMGFGAGIRVLPYAARPHFALSAGQVLYYGMGDAIDITGVPLNGGKQHRITLPHMPIFVTQAEREGTAARFRDSDLRTKIFENIQAMKPAFTGLLLDDAGHLWIRLSRPESGQTTTWLVLDNTGVVVAKANVPMGVRLLAVRGSRAFGTMTVEETGTRIAVAWDIGT